MFSRTIRVCWLRRLLERNLKTRYVREYFIPFRMMPDRMAQVRDQLQPLATTQVNRDFSPIAYYFDVVLWSAQFKPAYAGWLRAAEHVDFSNHSRRGPYRFVIHGGASWRLCPLASNAPARRLAVGWPRRDSR